jgi:hypothetical protein
MRQPRPTPMAWLADQAMRQALQIQRDRSPKPPNPKPPGRPCDDGASAAVLTWLLHRPSMGGWWSMTQVIHGTGRSAKACSWAVIFLARHGYIERERDVGNSRYLRYRASAAARTEFLQPGGMR